MSTVLRALWLFGFLAVLAGPLVAAELVGKVVGIHDGDTLTLLVPDGASFKQVKVRLGEIDTPESSLTANGPSRRYLIWPLANRRGLLLRLRISTGARWAGCMWAVWM